MASDTWLSLLLARIADQRIPSHEASPGPPPRLDWHGCRPKRKSSGGAAPKKQAAVPANNGQEKQTDARTITLISALGVTCRRGGRWRNLSRIFCRNLAVWGGVAGNRRFSRKALVAQVMGDCDLSTLYNLAGPRLTGLHPHTDAAGHIRGHP